MSVDSFTLPDHPDQPIKFSIWQKLVKKYGHGETERILYRVWAWKPKKVVPFILAGLRKGYLTNRCKNEWSNPEHVKAWINTNLRRQEAPVVRMKGEPESMKNLLKTYKAGA